MLQSRFQTVGAKGKDPCPTSTHLIAVSGLGPGKRRQRKRTDRPPCLHRCHRGAGQTYRQPSADSPSGWRWPASCATARHQRGLQRRQQEPWRCAKTPLSGFLEAQTRKELARRVRAAEQAQQRPRTWGALDARPIQTAGIASSRLDGQRLYFACGCTKTLATACPQAASGSRAAGKDPCAEILATRGVPTDATGIARGVWRRLTRAIDGKQVAGLTAGRSLGLSRRAPAGVNLKKELGRIPTRAE